MVRFVKCTLLMIHCVAQSYSKTSCLSYVVKLHNHSQSHQKICSVNNIYYIAFITLETRYNTLQYNANSVIKRL